MKKTFFFIIVLCLPSVLWAQSFSSTDDIYLDINTGLPVVSNTFTHTWKALPSAHLNLRIPFYRGRVEAGIRYIRFKGDAPVKADSDFHSLFIYLGYTLPIQITRRFQVGPAVRFGNNLMLFDHSKIYKSGAFRYKTDPAESEFAYEFALRSQFQLNPRWAVHATASYNRTLTKFPVPLTFISVGISYAFSQPQWLKTLLR